MTLEKLQLNNFQTYNTYDMNELTKFGPVKDIAQLALDVIYQFRHLAYELDCLDRYRVKIEELEDRWLQLVTSGGSHFPSRSSSSSRSKCSDA
jgi:hypothetical protein